MSSNRVCKTKKAEREHSLINYELMVISQSKDFRFNASKRGKSNFARKIADIGDGSEMFLHQNEKIENKPNQFDNSGDGGETEAN